jgi:hypothetical protein
LDEERRSLMSGKYYDVVDGLLRCYPEKKKSKTGPGPLADVGVWFAENRPIGSVELADLRRALYYTKTQGSFVVEKWSKGAFTVRGRASALLIESDETRHLLLDLL